MRKRGYIIAGAVFVLLLCLLGAKFLLNVNSTKLYVPEIERQVRISQDVPDTWEAVSETTDNIAAVLLYDGTSKEHVFVVYSKEPDANTDSDFSMIAGGALPVNHADIVELYCEDFDEFIYASMNQQKTCLLQITSDEKFSTIQVDPDKPFVIILSSKDGEITFYDADDNTIAFDTLRL